MDYDEPIRPDHGQMRNALVGGINTFMVDVSRGYTNHVFRTHSPCISKCVKIVFTILVNGFSKRVLQILAQIYTI